MWSALWTSAAFRYLSFLWTSAAFRYRFRQLNNRLKLPIKGTVTLQIKSIITINPILEICAASLCLFAVSVQSSPWFNVTVQICCDGFGNGEVVPLFHHHDATCSSNRLFSVGHSLQWERVSTHAQRKCKKKFKQSKQKTKRGAAAFYLYTANPACRVPNIFIHPHSGASHTFLDPVYSHWIEGKQDKL